MVLSDPNMKNQLSPDSRRTSCSAAESWRGGTCARNDDMTSSSRRRRTGRLSPLVSCAQKARCL